jgi:hypothetical protein
VYPHDLHFFLSVLPLLYLSRTTPVYISQAVETLRAKGMDIPEEYLTHLSPLGWEHINLTGDYVWNLKQRISFDNLRPLREKNF